MSRWPWVGKPRARDHPILVDDPEAPEPHVLRVSIVREREDMAAV